MKARLLALSALLAFVSLAGCKDAVVDNNTTTTTTNGAYFPLTTGSSWSYDGDAPGPYTVTITGDTTIGGKAYKVGVNSVSGAGYISYSNGEVWAINSGQTIPMMFLKEGAIGTTWSNDLTASGGTTHYIWSIAETGTTKTFNGKNYSDVIRVHQSASFVYAGQSIPFTESDYYYAKGIGFIGVEMTQNGSTMMRTDYLVSYTIK